MRWSSGAMFLGWSALLICGASWRLPSVWANAAPSPYSKAEKCRPNEEDGEFLQSCVQVTRRRGKTKTLGPGKIAPGGRAAAVLRHRRYGHRADRVKVQIYGRNGRPEGSYPMGDGGDEFLFRWAPGSSRYLAWIEVDGRGGTLRVVDRKRRRFALSVLCPLDEWPVFAPKSPKVMIPRPGVKDAPGESRVQRIVVMDLRSRRKKVLLQADKDQQLQDPQWVDDTTIRAQLLEKGQDKARPVVGRW